MSMYAQAHEPWQEPRPSHSRASLQHYHHLQPADPATMYTTSQYPPLPVFTSHTSDPRLSSIHSDSSSSSSPSLHSPLFDLSATADFPVLLDSQHVPLSYTTPSLSHPPPPHAHPSHYIHLPRQVEDIQLIYPDPCLTLPAPSHHPYHHQQHPSPTSLTLPQAPTPPTTTPPPPPSPSTLLPPSIPLPQPPAPLLPATPPPPPRPPPAPPRCCGRRRPWLPPRCFPPPPPLRRRPPR